MNINLYHLQFKDDKAISRSSNNSFVVASILFFKLSSHFKFYTIFQFPPSQVTGYEKHNPLGTPYEPSLIIAIETIYPGAVPIIQSWTWSHMALAAEAAEDLSLI